MQLADQCRPAYWHRGEGDTKLIFILYLTNIFCKHCILNPPPQKKKKMTRAYVCMKMTEYPPPPPPPPPPGADPGKNASENVVY